MIYLLHRSKKTKHQNHITKYLHFWRLGTFNRNKITSLMQFVFSVGGICITMCILRHLETCRPLLVLKQSCTAAQGLQPVSKKDLLATARHKHRVKTAKAMPESTSISLSPSKTPSTAGLLRWRRDGWRLHVLLLPCQCLQRKCGIVIGYINVDAWKRLIKSTKMDGSRDT